MSGFDCPNCGRDLDIMDFDLHDTGEDTYAFTGVAACIDCPGDESEEDESKDWCTVCGEDMYPDGMCTPHECRYEEEEDICEDCGEEGGDCVC